jgi:hypothetical protein
LTPARRLFTDPAQAGEARAGDPSAGGAVGAQGLAGERDPGRVLALAEGRPGLLAGFRALPYGAAEVAPVLDPLRFGPGRPETRPRVVPSVRRASPASAIRVGFSIRV